MSLCFYHLYHSWNGCPIFLDIVLFLAGLTVHHLSPQRSKKVSPIVGFVGLFLSFLDGHFYFHPNLPEQISIPLLYIGNGFLDLACGIAFALILMDIRGFFSKESV